MPAPADYVQVNERIQRFYEKYPDGSLQTWRAPYLEQIGDKAFIVYAAAAYRTPDDQRPGIGWAWEPVPGPTNFTKDSELQNAETSAWGRAIAALGFEVKNGIATQEDVRSRTATPLAAPPAAQPAAMTAKQKARVAELLAKPEISKSKVEAACQRDYGHGTKDMNGLEAATLIAQLEQFLKTQAVTA